MPDNFGRPYHPFLKKGTRRYVHGVTIWSLFYPQLLPLNGYTQQGRIERLSNLCFQYPWVHAASVFQLYDGTGFVNLIAELINPVAGRYYQLPVEYWLEPGSTLYCYSTGWALGDWCELFLYLETYNE